jgi:hypothetical protein
MRGEEEATRDSIRGKEEDEARAEEARGAKRKRSEEAAGTRARARAVFEQRVRERRARAFRRQHLLTARKELSYFPRTAPKPFAIHLASAESVA